MSEPGIRDLHQWVCWSSEERNGKQTKIPYSPTTGARARSDDPKTWSALSLAREAMCGKDYDGIGFVFTTTDPFCGVDLDGCLDLETGDVDSWALEIIEKLGSYTEISPSGTGLHVIVRAKLPDGGNRKGQIEMYDRGRFFTITGRRMTGTPHLIEERQEQIKALHSRLFPPPEENAPSTNVASTSFNDLSDEEVLRRAASAANGERFAALWAGDRSGYVSDSEADLARDKWNRKDYRSRTIARALDGAMEFYEPGNNDPGLSRNGHSRDIATSTRLTTSSTLPEAVQFPINAMPAYHKRSYCRPGLRARTCSLAHARDTFFGHRHYPHHRGQGRLERVGFSVRSGRRLSRSNEDTRCQSSQETSLRTPARSRQRLRRRKRGLEARGPGVGSRKM